MYAVGMVRGKMFTMRMSEAEAAKLDMLSRHFGESSAALVRGWIAEKYDAALAPAGEEAGIPTRGQLKRVTLDVLRAIRDNQNDQGVTPALLIARSMADEGLTDADRIVPRLLERLRLSEYVIRHAGGFSLDQKGIEVLAASVAKKK